MLTDVLASFEVAHSVEIFGLGMHDEFIESNHLDAHFLESFRQFARSATNVNISFTTS